MFPDPSVDQSEERKDVHHMDETFVLIEAGFSKTTLEPGVKLTLANSEPSISMDAQSALRLSFDVQQAYILAHVEAFIAGYVSARVVPEGATEEERRSAIAVIVGDFRDWYIKYKEKVVHSEGDLLQSRD